MRTDQDLLKLYDVLREAHKALLRVSRETAYSGVFPAGGEAQQALLLVSNILYALETEVMEFYPSKQEGLWAERETPLDGVFPGGLDSWLKDQRRPPS